MRCFAFRLRRPLVCAADVGGHFAMVHVVHRGNPRQSQIDVSNMKKGKQQTSKLRAWRAYSTLVKQSPRWHMSLQEAAAVPRSDGGEGDGGGGIRRSVGRYEVLGTLKY